MVSIRLGVNCMLQLKSREFLVGSGQGGICLVRDVFVPETRVRRGGGNGPIVPEAPRTIQEPTKTCLQEV